MISATVCGWTDRSLSDERRRRAATACSRDLRRTSLLAAQLDVRNRVGGPLGVARFVGDHIHRRAVDERADPDVLENADRARSRTTRMSPISSPRWPARRSRRASRPSTSECRPSADLCTSPASVRNDPDERVAPRAVETSAIRSPRRRPPRSIATLLALLRLCAAEPVGMAMRVGIVAVALAGTKPRGRRR